MATKRAPSLPKPSRHFAAGGILGASPIDPNGSDYDAINAEKTIRWAADDAMSKMNGTGTRTERAAFGQQLNSIVSKAPGLFDSDTLESQMRNAGTRTARAAIGNAMGIVSGDQAAKSFLSITPGIVSANAVTPVPTQETTWQQDSDARQSRITAYADRLKGMEANGRANSLMGSNSTITRGFAKGGNVGAAIAANGLTVGVGGKVDGPGTPTSDSIPAKVRETGEAIRISTQERILSKAQDAFLEDIAKASGFDSLNALLEAGTGKPVGPTLKAGKRAAATGMAPEDDQRTAAAIAAPPTLGGAPFARSEPAGALTGPTAGIVGDPFGGKSSPLGSGLFNIDPKLAPGASSQAQPAKPGRDASGIAAPLVLGGGIVTRTEPSAGALSPAAAKYRPELNGITWSAKGFDPTKESMPQGTGAITVTSGPNAGKNIAIGPQNYVAADGSQTSDWSKTAQYAQGMAQAQRDRDMLAMMQRDRLERDAYDPSITDPNVRASARAQIAEQDAKASKAGEAQGRMLDNQGKLVKLASEKQMVGLQAQYLAETDPARREAIAERIRGVTGKGDGATAWQHVETEKGMMAFNPKTLRMEPVRGPDGKPVASTKALTEYQGKSAGFGMRANEASQIIDQVGQGGKVQPSLIKRAAEAVPLIGEGLGMVANKFASAEQQQVEQAQRDFVNAVLRQESGAAISASEFDNARKQYFPAPNDTPEVVAQKQTNREMAINGFRVSAGPGGKHIGGTPAPAQQQAQQQPAAGPKAGTVDGKHVFLGGNPADPASWAELR